MSEEIKNIPGMENEAVETPVPVEPVAQEVIPVQTPVEAAPVAEQTAAPAEAVPVQQEVKRCANCAAVLEAGQAFCSECGAVQKKVCTQCGAELKDGEVFCTSCGHKNDTVTAEGLNPDIARFNASIANSKKKSPIIPIIIGVIAVCIVAVIIFFSTAKKAEDYLNKGDYEKAYDVAKGEEDKDDIVKENILAVVSADCVDSMKDPESFDLRDAWIYVSDDSVFVVLKVAGNNSYGNTIINYWFYGYDEDDEAYELYTTFADFDEETIYSWDDYEEEQEKIMKNLCKDVAASIIDDGYNSEQYDSEEVDRINSLFEKDILENVELLDEMPQVIG